MQRRVEATFADVVVALSTGREGAFEVALDGDLLHSKLDSGAFPDVTATVTALQQRGCRRRSPM